MEYSKQNYNLLIAKKTEKIVTAIYLVSQFLKDTESIKKNIRVEADNLLKYGNKIAYIDLQDAGEIFVLYKNFLDSVSLLISYLTISKDVNLISRMNSQIVIEGLRILENILIKKQFTLSKESLYINNEEDLLKLVKDKDIENQNISQNTSFDVFTERNKNIEENFNKENKEEFLFKNFKKEKDTINLSPKGQSIKDIKNIDKNKSEIIETKNIQELNKVNKINNKISKIVNKDNTPKTIKKPKNQDRKDNRREQILSLFARGTEVSINDISKKIIGCSVKTIQRELNTLLEEKKINKIGEKRWSKYILI